MESGDTLQKISALDYGTSELWDELADPNKLALDQKILIPQILKEVASNSAKRLVENYQVRAEQILV